MHQTKREVTPLFFFDDACGWCELFCVDFYGGNDNSRYADDVNIFDSKPDVHRGHFDNFDSTWIARRVLGEISMLSAGRSSATSAAKGLPLLSATYAINSDSAAFAKLRYDLIWVYGK